MQPYPEYKYSGMPLLGKIPVHWQEKRAKFYFREVDERSKIGDEELLSVSHLTGVTPRSQKNVTMFKAESYIGHKLCRPQDIVVNTMWAWMAALGVARQNGIVSPSYAVYRPRINSAFNPEYLDHLLRTQSYASEYICRSTGIRSSRLRLYPEQFLDISVLSPPRKEQEHIVAYLNGKDRQIRRYIRNKQRLIKLLNEQKQAIINRAVTRGLDPDVRLKPSGVFWTPEIPVAWEVRPIKREFDCLNHRRIPLSGIQRGSMNEHTYDYYGASGVIDHVEKYLFDDELLLIAEDGANLVLRNLPLAIIACGKFWVNNHAHILKPRKGNLQYFAYLLESINYRPWITGAAQPKLTQERLMNIQIPVPPVEEQDNIVETLYNQTKTMTQGIDFARREIDLIREYRTRLIADVVTGKVDVRHLAPATDQGMDEEEVFAEESGWEEYEPEDGELEEEGSAGEEEEVEGYYTPD